MAAVNSVQTARLPLPAFSPHAVLMYSAAVGGEGAVALQLREATASDLDSAARLHQERLNFSCNEPELLVDFLQAAADIDMVSTSSSSPHNSVVVSAGVTTVSVAVAGIEARPHAPKRVRPKPASPNRQGPQQCQVCNKIFGNASALAKHKLTHSDERKYVCTMCSKAFKRQDHLNGHMLTHRNKKPYECKADGCGKSYCDARSLRRHTENHHQPTTSEISSSGAGERENNAQSCGVSPASSPSVRPTHSDSSNSSEKSSKSGSTSGVGSGNSSDCSPPATPPAPPPATPPARRKSRAKSKLTTNLQTGRKSAGNLNKGATCNTTSSGKSQNDGKPVECNLCHRKFKNIPALNGHMRLHGGYFKKDSDSKKSDKKENNGPPLQTASMSVRALIEEKIISRRGASANSTAVADASTSRPNFIAPAAPPPLPPLSTSQPLIKSPSSPATTTATTTQFIPPRAPPVVSVATSVANMSITQRDSTLIDLLKKGNTKVVKRSSSDPGQFSPQSEMPFRPELFGVSFHSDDGYFSPALQDDTFQFTTGNEHLEELASLEDYATVAASIQERSPVTYPSNRRLAAVLNSPLPESLADFGACHGGSPVQSPAMGYANSPGLSYSTGDSPGLSYADTSPGGAYSAQAVPSPSLGYPTPPGSHDAQSPSHTIPRASSPLTAAFFTATMSSQEEVEEALEEVLPEECGSLDAFALEPPRRIMLNSEDPLLSSSPRDFVHQRPQRRQQNLCVEGNDLAAFLSSNSVTASPQRRKRRHSLGGPYRSRMRRSMLHYTPQPILHPEREGTGLLFEQDEGDHGPQIDIEMDEPRVPRINIGPDHQAVIPEPCGDRDDLHRAPEQLLWDPGINDSLDDNEVRMFMELAMCAAMPVGGHSREHALKVLGECDGDIRAATLRLMSREPEPDNSDRWTPDEVETYLAGLRHYDKDFYRIAQLIRTKNSKQCIQFYYFWKKLTKNYKTLFLRSWNMSVTPNPEQASTSREIPVPPSSPSTSSPSPFEGEEFPCKICGK